MANGYMDKILNVIKSVPNHLIVDADKLAKEAGSGRATNMVITGAASHRLPLKVETMEQYIKDIFARKGEKVVDTNLKAFASGREKAA